MDGAGAVSATGGLAALVFGLVNANQWGWGSASTLGVFVGAGVFLGTFVVLQVRSSHPLVPPRLFRSRALVAANLGMLLVGAGVFAMFFFLTLYMQQVLHYSAVRTGLGYLAVTAMSIASATIGSRILARVGAHRILTTGFLMTAAGLALLLRISSTTGYLDILPSLVLIGGGDGAAFVSMMSLAVAGVPREDTGIASALLNASQQVGGSLGIGLLTAVAAARFDAVRPRHPTPATLAAATISSWAWAFVVAAVLLLAAAVASNLLLRIRPPESMPVAQVESAATEPSADTEPATVRPATATRRLASLPPPCHGGTLSVFADVAVDP